MFLKSLKIQLFVFAALIVLSTLIYLPGVSGPYVFDDYSNLLNNSFVQVKSLDFDTLKNASFSLAAGPLKRPVAMLSFALNYYFAGSFDKTAPFKMVNVAIHALNGLLVFWLTRIVIARLGQLRRVVNQTNAIRGLGETTLAAVVALLWLVHPIQLTSVLYIVQRMTLLSAFFVLLGAITYIKGRSWMINGDNRGWGLMIFAFLGCGTLGMFSKENAILLPVFIAAIEYTLFPNEQPWKSWEHLPRHWKVSLLLSGAVLAVATLLIALHVALPGYSIRQFNMTERLMTEPRVLFFYISLILVPRINEFGLLHDDIEISRSLMSPWTTLPSLLALGVILGYALFIRRRQPLLSLGVLWFFGAHLLESTIFPLEIAHEHRNYLATFGVVLTLIHLLDLGSIQLGHRKLWSLIPVMAIVFAGTTYARSVQWSDANSLYRYEAVHHPDSAGAQAGLSTLLNSQGDYKGAISALRRAAELEPNEVGFLMGMQWIAARHGVTLSQSEEQETLRLLTAYPISATAGFTLISINECILTTCRGTQKDMEIWMKALLKKNLPGSEASFYYYLLGRASVGQGKIQQAIDAFIASYQNDTMYLHPLIELTNLYIHLDKPEQAERVLTQLRRINEKNLHPRNAEIAELQEMLARAKPTDPSQRGP